MSRRETDSEIVSVWLRKLLERKPRKVAAVALANNGVLPPRCYPGGAGGGSS